MRLFYILTVSALVVILASSSATVQYHNGIAGYTGSPGEGTCNSCHSGGSSAASGITISAVPSFSNNEYLPDSAYEITVSGAAAGFNRFGFGCEILDENNINAGTLSASQASGVKILPSFNGRDNAVHTVPKVADTVQFVFPWTAPSSGSVTIYAMVNAVNGNGNNGGDFPLSPVSLALSPYVAPIDTTQDTTSITEFSMLVSPAALYPNPASQYVHLSFELRNSASTWVVINDLKGREVLRTPQKFTQVGAQQLNLNVSTQPPGTYVLSLYSEKGMLTHKRLLIN